MPVTKQKNPIKFVKYSYKGVNFLRKRNEKKMCSFNMSKGKLKRAE